MNMLSNNKNIFKVSVIIVVVIMAVVSMFGYYRMYTMFKTYGGTHLLKTICTAIELGMFLSAYFSVRHMLKLPIKISLLNKIEVIFLFIFISSGYLAFKPLQMPLFMIFSFMLPVIVVVYIISDTICYTRKYKKNKYTVNNNKEKTF